MPLLNRAMEQSTTVGTADYALGGAIVGYVPLAGLGNGGRCRYIAIDVDVDGVPQGGREEGVGEYSTTGPTLVVISVIRSTNSNNKVSWATGTRRIAATLFVEDFAGLSAARFDGRLTTESNEPLSVSDRLAQGTLFWSPCIRAGISTSFGFISTFDGSFVRHQEFGEVSLALTLTAGKPCDVFIKNSDLSLVLSNAWTNDTTRADALAKEKNLIVAAADHSYTWLGTIYASASNVVEDSLVKRYVWNAHNQLRRMMERRESTDSWPYSTNSVFQQANANAANQLDYVVGEANAQVEANVFVKVNVSTVGDPVAGIGVDSATVNSARFYGTTIATGEYATLHAFYNGAPGLGRHILAWIERGNLNGGTTTWYGDHGNNIYDQYGIRGWLSA